MKPQMGWTLAFVAFTFCLFSGCTTIKKNKDEVAYHLYGNGPEKVVVMHDWMGDSSNYRATQKYLDTDRFTFAFIDIRGYGESKELSGPYTASQAGEDAFNLADKLGWSKFNVVGHSMTGMVVQWMALQDFKKQKSERRILGVVAITPVSADGYPATKEDLEFFNAVIMNKEVSAKAFFALTGQRYASTWGEVKADRHLQTAKKVALEGYLYMWAHTDISKEISQANIDIPFLVIGGRQDLPGFQEAHFKKTFAKWYKNLTIKYITDAGHYPMEETPVYLASIINEFLTINKREKP